jgi:hypothetical protein
MNALAIDRLKVLHGDEIVFNDDVNVWAVISFNFFRGNVVLQMCYGDENMVSADGDKSEKSTPRGLRRGVTPFFDRYYYYKTMMGLQFASALSEQRAEILKTKPAVQRKQETTLLGRCLRTISLQEQRDPFLNRDALPPHLHDEIRTRVEEVAPTSIEFRVRSLMVPGRANGPLLLRLPHKIR